jgi:hypothetical protein
VQYIWRYLTSPGRSLTSYVLRLAPMLMASWVIAQGVALWPDIVSGSVRIEWNLKPEALFEMHAVVLIFLTVAGAAVASLISWTLVVAFQRVSRNRFLVALAIGVLLAGVVGMVLHSMRAIPVASASIGILFGWVFFVSAIANQVGQLTSNIHGLAASFFLLASASLFSAAFVASFSVESTPCEQRHSPEREQCIIHEEHVRAMIEDQKLLDELSTEDAGDWWDEQFLKSVAPATERMLRAKMKECDALPMDLPSACAKAFRDAQKWAPEAMTRHAEDKIQERRFKGDKQRD